MLPIRACNSFLRFVSDVGETETGLVQGDRFHSRTGIRSWVSLAGTALPCFPTNGQRSAAGGNRRVGYLCLSHKSLARHLFQQAREPATLQWSIVILASCSSLCGSLFDQVQGQRSRLLDTSRSMYPTMRFVPASDETPSQ